MKNAFPNGCFGGIVSSGSGVSSGGCSLRFSVDGRSFFKGESKAKHARNSQSVSQLSGAYMGCVHSGVFFFLPVFLFMALFFSLSGWEFFCLAGSVWVFFFFFF